MVDDTGGDAGVALKDRSESKEESKESEWTPLSSLVYGIASPPSAAAIGASVKELISRSIDQPSGSGGAGSCTRSTSDE